MSVNKKTLTYIFLNGRSERINSELNFPYEFFYGYNFLKNFFHTTLFENFLPTDASVANAKNQPSQGLGTPQNRSSAKKSIFSKSEISSPQSNHGKRNIKLMLVRP